MMPTGGVEQLGQAHPAVRHSIELPRVTGEMVIAVSIKRFEREHALEAMADLIIVHRADPTMHLDALVDDKARLVGNQHRSEEHTSELQSLMRIPYAVFSLKKKTKLP